MITRIIESITKYPERNAFYIKDKFFTYAQLEQKISNINNILLPYLNEIFPKYIGVMMYDDFESYASCISVLLSGYGYVPINPLNPKERNLEVIYQADLKIILSSNKLVETEYKKEINLTFIDTNELPDTITNLEFSLSNNDDPAYVIFTSGSTGTPKGTPISRKNLNAFIDSAVNLGWNFSENDKFLQMSSMTFDMSIITCILPLCFGACIYTVPEEEIKYLYAYRLIKEHLITVIGFLPSTISYFKPYFDEIKLPSIRYSLIGGEALPLDLINQWNKCIPNAEIYNMYGPTEGTVFSHVYKYQKESANKDFNGIVAIGSPVKNAEVLILDTDGSEIVAIGQKGELCLSGNQVTSGYLKNPGKTQEHFLTKWVNGKEKIIYKTGDIVFIDNENCYFYVGRKDHQVKIQGHRVELGDIEKHARDITQTENTIVIAHLNEFGNYQIHLFTEKISINHKIILKYLKSKLPYYMIPSKVTVLEKMPMNVNGKIDRIALAEMINKK
jgi:D-alanine--poly(phosphoribitol) ligase subunit 1